MRIPVHYPSEPWQSPCAGTDLPYDWVPIALNKAGDGTRDDPRAPLWHDGANPDQKDLYSGELRILLTTKSPLLVGNQRIELGELSDPARSAIETSSAVAWPGGVERARDTAKQNQQQRTQEEIDRNFRTLVDKHREKSILAPLRLGPDGPVLIPGESLKGMFRHAYAALLSSPIERVVEMNYSYRPNQFVGREGTTCEPRAAVIQTFNEATLEMKVKLLPFPLNRIDFVHGDECIFTPPVAGGWPRVLDAGARVTNKQCKKWHREDQTEVGAWQGTGGRWKNSGAGQDLDADKTLWLRYHFGLNGKNGYVKTGPSPNPVGHPSALVPMQNQEFKDYCASPAITVNPAVVRQYLATREHLKDEKAGQASRLDASDRPKAQAGYPTLQPGDLVFCEVLEPEAAEDEHEVIAFGHNFRYRWRHLNSVTRLTTAFDGGTGSTGNWVDERRVEMRAHPDERPGAAAGADAPQPPQKLSAVRNLFGYVTDKGNEAFKAGQDDGLLALRDPFNRLAGRVSFNFAVERVNPGETDAQRFVNDSRGCWVFLHPTAEPKPSQSRSYVPGSNRTWGEGLLEAELETTTTDPNGQQVQVTPGCYWLQGGTRNFAGRKFYLHQLDSGNGAVPSYHYDLGALYTKKNNEGNRCKVTAHSVWELVQYLWGQHSTVARCVSKAGREFGFTVRFKDLRPVELAALVAVLDPDLLAEVVLRDQEARLTKTKAHLKTLKEAQRLAFGHKLGYGRALGLGSVALQRKKAIRWPQTLDGEDGELTVDSLSALIATELLPLLDDLTTLHWFRALQFSGSRAGREQPRPYLCHRDNGHPETMVGWAQGQRKERMNTAREEGLA